MDWRQGGAGLLQTGTPEQGRCGRQGRHSDPGSATLQYRPKQSARLGTLEAARAIEDTSERVRNALPRQGQGRRLPSSYARADAALHRASRSRHRVLHRRCRSCDAVGVRLELGPFETWDAIGIQAVLDATETAASDAPPIVAEALKSGRSRFREGTVPPASADLQILRAARDRQQVVRRNAGASLVDLGDGVLAVEFHSKKNSIGADTIQMLQAGLKEAAANFQALVAGGALPHRAIVRSTAGSRARGLPAALSRLEDAGADPTHADPAGQTAQELTALMTAGMHEIAIVERGHGVPVVLIPGIQGRWQSFEPAFDALSASCRAITYSLDGEPGSGGRPAASGESTASRASSMPCWTRSELERAVLCGVSFGGLVALRYTATRPTRTAGLVLASTLGPGFHLRPRHLIYARLPSLFGPLFLAEMPARVRRDTRRPFRIPLSGAGLNRGRFGTS